MSKLQKMVLGIVLLYMAIGIFYYIVIIFGASALGNPNDTGFLSSLIGLFRAIFELGLGKFFSFMFLWPTLLGRF